MQSAIYFDLVHITIVVAIVVVQYIARSEISMLMAEKACRSYCLMRLRIYRSACCTASQIIPMLINCAEVQTKMFFYCNDASLLSLASPQVEHSMTTRRAAHSVDICREYAILIELTHWWIVLDDDVYLHTSNMQLKT